MILDLFLKLQAHWTVAMWASMATGTAYYAMLLHHSAKLREQLADTPKAAQRMEAKQTVSLDDATRPLRLPDADAIADSRIEGGVLQMRTHSGIEVSVPVDNITHRDIAPRMERVGFLARAIARNTRSYGPIPNGYVADMALAAAELLFCAKSFPSLSISISEGGKAAKVCTSRPNTESVIMVDMDAATPPAQQIGEAIAAILMPMARF